MNGRRQWVIHIHDCQNAEEIGEGAMGEVGVRIGIGGGGVPCHAIGSILELSIL